MRLLFVTHNFPRHDGDAPGAFVWRLAHALQTMRASASAVPAATVEVIAPGAPGLPADDVIGGVRVHRVAYAGAEIAYGGTMAEAVRSSWSGRRAIVSLLAGLRAATRRHVDEARRSGRPVSLVHAHWWFPAGLAVHAARWPGAHRLPPYVVTMHGSDVRLARGTAPAHPLMRRVLRGAAAVSAVSQWLADEARAIVPDVAIDVAPMPIDTGRFADDVGDATPAADRAGLLFVGRLNTQKGLADLLDALARLRMPAPLTVVGDGPDADALRARAARLGVADRVRWVGALPNAALPALYRQAVATVMPSREEGLGLVAAESQLCGTPVVAYDSGGVRDVVDPSAGGALVPPGDVPALAAALDALLADPVEAATRGRRGALRIAARFAPEAVATRYTAWYQHALGAARGAPAT